MTDIKNKTVVSTKKTLDENLNEFYKDKGEVFKNKSAALKLLESRGFYEMNGFYENNKGERAYLTKIRDSFCHREYGERVKVVVDKYLSRGWLITWVNDFNPVRLQDLQFCQRVY